MTTTRKSSRRFRRPPAPSAIALTEDDISILWHVFRHRIIDSKSLYSLFPTRSEQVISRRLKRLWENDLLDRPLAQNIRPTLTAGSDYLVYALGREGARYLRHKIDSEAMADPVRWTRKNAQLRPQSIQHHLSTTRFMVRVAAGILDRDDAEMVYADRLLQDAPVTKRAGVGLSNTLRANVDWHSGRSVQGTAPDQVFALHIGDETQIFFLEIDEGTETIAPSKRKQTSDRFWRETSFLRKMVIYSSAFREKAHHQQFGLPSFRVLTVTTSPDRSKTMQAAWRDHLSSGANKATPGLFLFTDWQTLDLHQGSVLKLPLENAAGRTIIIDRSAL